MMIPFSCFKHCKRIKKTSLTKLNFKRTVITETDVALARRKAELTQDQFAKILGVSKRTLESWEQGVRRPSGAATSLIRLFIVDPKFVKESLA